MEQKQITGWMDIALSNYHTKRKVKIRGNSVDVYVSPYDIPKAIRAILDRDNKTLTIEFKYLNDEAIVQKTEGKNEHVKYSFGQFSNRLYAITFDLEGFMKSADIKSNITKRDTIFSAIETLLKNSDKESPKDNYELVKDALKSREAELLSAAA